MKFWWGFLLIWAVSASAANVNPGACEDDLGEGWSITNAIITGNAIAPNSAYAVQAYVLARFLARPKPLSALGEESPVDDQRKLMKAAFAYHQLYRINARELSASASPAAALARAAKTIRDTKRNIRHVLNQIVTAEIYGRVTSSDHVDANLFDEFFVDPTRLPPAVRDFARAILETFASPEFKARAERYVSLIARTSASTDPSVRAGHGTYVHCFDRDLGEMFLGALMQMPERRSREFLALLPR